jgi:hypothetical protein
MGGTWDAADVAGSRNKEEYKAALAQMPVGSPENFLSKLMQRTSEAVRLSDELESTKKQTGELAALERDETLIDDAVDAGSLTESQAYTMQRARRKQFRTQREKLIKPELG